MLKLLVVLVVLVAFLVRLLYVAWHLGFTSQESVAARATALCLLFVVLVFVLLTVVDSGV